MPPVRRGGEVFELYAFYLKFQKMKSERPKDGSDLKGKWSMHYGATAKLFELAESLRERMTEAEKILWDSLRNNEWQLNFRRQHPISIYIADFYCHKLKLVIELDGGYHENKDVKIHDVEREKDIIDFCVIVCNPDRNFTFTGKLLNYHHIICPAQDGIRFSFCCPDSAGSILFNCIPETVQSFLYVMK